MTENELRELIQGVIQEYMGTGASGGNAGDGNNITSPRVGGRFYTDQQEIDNYTNKEILDDDLKKSLGNYYSLKIAGKYSPFISFSPIKLFSVINNINLK